jgi:hypothetical protein
VASGNGHCYGGRTAIMLAPSARRRNWVVVKHRSSIKPEQGVDAQPQESRRDRLRLGRRCEIRYRDYRVTQQGVYPSC